MRDALVEPQRREDRATIYLLVGEPGLALDELERLLAMPAQISLAQVRVDPLWEPVLDHPRMRRLLERDSR